MQNGKLYQKLMSLGLQNLGPTGRQLFGFSNREEKIERSIYGYSKSGFPLRVQKHSRIFMKKTFETIEDKIGFISKNESFFTSISGKKLNIEKQEDHDLFRKLYVYIDYTYEDTRKGKTGRTTDIKTFNEVEKICQ